MATDHRSQLWVGSGPPIIPLLYLAMHYVCPCLDNKRGDDQLISITQIVLTIPGKESGDWLNIKISSYQSRKSHYKDKTVS